MPSMLFSPYKLRGTEFPNRLVLAPMQMYKTPPDGMFTDWHFQHLAKFAVGGFGTVMTEALMVVPRGRNTYGDCGIWSDDHIAPLKKFTAFMHSLGKLAAAQLHHAGPKASRQRPWEGIGPLGEAEAAKGEPPWRPQAATTSETVSGWHTPEMMTVEDIAEVVAAYGRGAARCAEAGFDVMDIHAAHGYLLHSFLSPVNNNRTDAYGGSLENRSRFALEVAKAVRTNWPDDKPLIFRLSCVDWRPDLDPGKVGWTIEDSIALSLRLQEVGVDMIDCSSGGIRAENSMVEFNHKRTPQKKGFQVPYADAIRNRAPMPTMAVGAIVDGPQAEKILQEGKADLIAVARQALVDPHFGLTAARQLGTDPEWKQWPPSYGWWLQKREQVGLVD